MSNPIQLIVGLGNPGPEYEHTRHNAGAWFVRELATQYSGSWRKEKKFPGELCKIRVAEQDCYLFIPGTYMNESGRAVKAITHFYKIPITEILVAHDELDLPVDSIRLKQGGGHGGHNGLRDLIKSLSDNNFFRIRIGIGHPGHRDDVHDYVLHKPSRSDKDKIDDAINEAINVINTAINGNIAAAMKKLHTNNEGES